MKFFCSHCGSTFVESHSASVFCSRQCFQDSKKALAEKTFVDRFRERTIRRESGCVEWTGAVIASTGYGVTMRAQKTLYVHRISFELEKGQIPNGMQVCHKCDNRLCVNPDHLFLGTAHDNMSDCAAKERIAHGTRNKKSKLNPDAVRQMRAARAAGEAIRRIGLRFGVSETTAGNVIHGRTWARVV